MKPLMLKRWMTTLAAAACIAFVGGVASARPALAISAGRCGTGIECYSVPDGCGQGGGCQRVFCWMSICPSILGGDEYCYFCQNES